MQSNFLTIFTENHSSCQPLSSGALLGWLMLFPLLAAFCRALLANNPQLIVAKKSMPANDLKKSSLVEG
jgi:hypothetical protein